MALVNSASFGLANPVGNVERALSFLGDNTLRALVLSIPTWQDEDLSKPELLDVPRFWTHSLTTALFAEKIAEFLKLEKPGDLFTCGLLHDVGQLVQFRLKRSELEQIRREQRVSDLSTVEAERALGVLGHAYWSERVAESWTLPMHVRKCLRVHHRPWDALSVLPGKERIEAQIVQIADRWRSESQARIPESRLRDVNLTESQLQKIEGLVQIELNEALELLGLPKQKVA